MKEPIVVKMSMNNVSSSTLMGTRERLIAESLQHNGIPAHAGHGGIHVKTGELTVHEEEGLRVFTWQSPEENEENNGPQLVVDESETTTTTEATTQEEPERKHKAPAKKLSRR